MVGRLALAGGGELRNAIGASFAVGEGNFVGDGLRRARVLLLDPTYSASFPIGYRAGVWKLEVGAAGGLSGVAVLPEGDERTTYCAGVRMETDVTMELERPRLRFALTTGLRPTFTLDAAKSELLLFDAGISAGWAFAI
jgi:hypothetical protein